jgi:hypothetical protein
VLVKSNFSLWATRWRVLVKSKVLVTPLIGDSAPPARLRGTVEAVEGLAIPASAVALERSGR